MSREEPKREYRNGDISEMLELYLRQQEFIMSALTDLQAAVAGLTSEVTAVVAALGAAVPGSIAPADAEAVVTQINAATASLTAALTPAAPVAPVAPVAPAA